MSLNPDIESRLDAWRREVREHVRAVIESDVDGPIGTDVDPYPGGARVGYAPVLVLFAGRDLTDADSPALGPAAALEFARLHLRTHGTLVREGETPSTTPLLSGDLYRALANRLVVEQAVPISRRLEALEILSRSVLEELDAMGRDESTDSEWLLADGALEIGSVLFALDDDQRRSLRRSANRLRSDRREARLTGSTVTGPERDADD